MVAKNVTTIELFEKRRLPNWRYDRGVGNNLREVFGPRCSPKLCAGRAGGAGKACLIGSCANSCVLSELPETRHPAAARRRSATDSTRCAVPEMLLCAGHGSGCCRQHSTQRSCWRARCSRTACSEGATRTRRTRGSWPTCTSEWAVRLAFCMSESHRQLSRWVTGTPLVPAVESRCRQATPYRV